MKQVLLFSVSLNSLSDFIYLYKGDKIMAKYKFYADGMSNNGTNGLFVVDKWDQVVDYIPEAIFGYHPQFEDGLGNVTAVFYGESVGTISYDFISYEDELSEEEIENSVITRDWLFNSSDITPVGEVRPSEIMSRIACSPLDPSGYDVLSLLTKYLSIKKYIPNKELDHE